MHPLAKKYVEILALRTADNDGNAPIARIRALATAFPGALRELDQLPLDEIRRRLGLLSDCDSLNAPFWAQVMTSFHQALADRLRDMNERRALVPAGLNVPGRRLSIEAAESAALAHATSKEYVHALFSGKTLEAIAREFGENAFRS